LIDWKETERFRKIIGLKLLTF